VTLWFTWDRGKADANLRKHGVSFETARLVFVDPIALSDQDRIEVVIVVAPPSWSMTMATRRSASSRSGPPQARRGRTMTVNDSASRSKLELTDSPTLDAEQEAELAALAERSDADIDLSDIPPLDAAFWRQAARKSVLLAGEDAAHRACRQ
jgi:hypothetical protein